MTVDQGVAVFSALLSLIGLLAVAVQMRSATTQRRLETLHRMTDNNRELLSLAFAHPQLLEVLVDATIANPEWERRYLQMWLNQFSLIHSHLKHGGFDAEFLDSLERDIADFMGMKNMQRHWNAHGDFYPPSFQDLVNAILSRVEPPPTMVTES